MKKTLLRLCVAAIALSQLSFAALLTDGVDQVTYGVFTYKWKNLIDALYIHKIKGPYMYYKLGGLTDTTPFITTYEFGYGTVLGPNSDTFFAIAGSYKDTTGSFSSYNSNIVNTTNNYATNGVSAFTNGTASALTTFSDTDLNPATFGKGVRTFDGSLAFGKKIGDAYLNILYQPTIVGSYSNAIGVSSPTKTFTNGSLTGASYAYGTNNGIQDAGSVNHSLSFGLISGTFELQGFLQAKINNASMYAFQTNDTATTLVGGDLTERVSSTTRNIMEGSHNVANAAALANDVTTVLRHTLLNFQLSPRIENISDMKFYLLFDYTTGIFDPAQNVFRTYTENKNFDTNGNKLLGNTNTDVRTEYLNASYNKFVGQLRMKRVWKGDSVSFGLYPRYILTYTASAYARRASQVQGFYGDLNGNGVTTDAGDTNYTITSVGGMDAKSVTTVDHDLRFPVAAQWKVSKFFTLYAGATARYQATFTTTRTEETANGVVSGNEYLNVTNSGTVNNTSEVAKTTINEVTTPNLRLVGSYAAGLLWTPSQNLEFMVTFNGERPFNQIGNTASVFTGADLNVIWNF